MVLLNALPPAVLSHASCARLITGLVLMHRTCFPFQAAQGGLSDAELEHLLRREDPPANMQQQQQQAALQGPEANGPKSGAASGSRLLSADACAPLVSLMLEHNKPKDKDAGKVFGRGMRAVNAAMGTGGSTGSGAVMKPLMGGSIGNAAATGAKPAAAPISQPAPTSASGPEPTLGATKVKTVDQPVSGGGEVTTQTAVAPSGVRVTRARGSQQQPGNRGSAAAPGAAASSGQGKRGRTATQSKPDPLAKESQALAPVDSKPSVSAAVTGPANGRDSSPGQVEEPQLAPGSSNKPASQLHAAAHAPAAAALAAAPSSQPSQPLHPPAAPDALPAQPQGTQDTTRTLHREQQPPQQQAQLASVSQAQKGQQDPQLGQELGLGVSAAAGTQGKGDSDGDGMEQDQDEEEPAPKRRRSNRSQETAPKQPSGRADPSPAEVNATGPVTASQEEEDEGPSGHKGQPPMPDFMAQLRQALTSEYGWQGNPSLDGWTATGLYSGAGRRNKMRWYPYYHHPDHPSQRSVVAVARTLGLSKSTQQPPAGSEAVAAGDQVQPEAAGDRPSAPDAGAAEAPLESDQFLPVSSRLAQPAARTGSPCNAAQGLKPRPEAVPSPGAVQSPEAVRSTKAVRAPAAVQPAKAAHAPAAASPEAVRSPAAVLTDGEQDSAQGGAGEGSPGSRLLAVLRSSLAHEYGYKGSLDGWSGSGKTWRTGRSGSVPRSNVTWQHAAYGSFKTVAAVAAALGLSRQVPEGGAHVDGRDQPMVPAAGTPARATAASPTLPAQLPGQPLVPAAKAGPRGAASPAPTTAAISAELKQQGSPALQPSHPQLVPRPAQPLAQAADARVPTPANTSLHLPPLKHHAEGSHTGNLAFTSVANDSPEQHEGSPPGSNPPGMPDFMAKLSDTLSAEYGWHGTPSLDGWTATGMYSGSGERLRWYPTWYPPSHMDHAACKSIAAVARALGLEKQPQKSQQAHVTAQVASVPAQAPASEGVAQAVPASQHVQPTMAPSLLQPQLQAAAAPSQKDAPAGLPQAQGVKPAEAQHPLEVPQTLDGSPPNHAVTSVSGQPPMPDYMARLQQQLASEHGWQGTPSLDGWEASGVYSASGRGGAKRWTPRFKCAGHPTMPSIAAVARALGLKQQGSGAAAEPVVPAGTSGARASAPKQPAAEEQLQVHGAGAPVAAAVAAGAGTGASAGTGDGGSTAVGTGLLGQRVRVFWPLDDAWYTGTFKKYDEKKGKHQGKVVPDSVAHCSLLSSSVPLHSPGQVHMMGPCACHGISVHVRHARICHATVVRDFHQMAAHTDTCCIMNVPACVPLACVLQLLTHLFHTRLTPCACSDVR